MAFGSVVDEARGEAMPLADALRHSGIDQVAQVLLVDEFGNWRLLLVTTELESEGMLSLARRLHAFIQEGDLPTSALERVEIVGPEDWHLLSASRPGDSVLSWRREADDYESVALTIWSKPEFRRAFESVVEQQIADAFVARGAVVRRMPSFGRRLRADLEVALAGKRVLIEVKQSSRQTHQSRFREMAGLANLARTPVVLVLLSDYPVSHELRDPQGEVPVCAVDWSADGIDGVIRTVELL